MKSQALILISFGRSKFLTIELFDSWVVYPTAIASVSLLFPFETVDEVVSPQHYEYKKPGFKTLIVDPQA